MKDTFKLYPDLKSYHETSDGQKFFIPTDAANHARTLIDKTVKEVKRGSSKKEAANDSKDSKLNAIQAAKLRKEAIEKLETVEAVEKALETETAKSVKAAGEKRIEELKAFSTASVDSSEEEE
ncbi:hypothetical protein N9609_00610 [bacterium]|nr:hypothetical protein [bacterium]